MIRPLLLWTAMYGRSKEGLKCLGTHMGGTNTLAECINGKREGAGSAGTGEAWEGPAAWCLGALRCPAGCTLKEKHHSSLWAPFLFGSVHNFRARGFLSTQGPNPFPSAHPTHEEPGTICHPPCSTTLQHSSGFTAGVIYFLLGNVCVVGVSGEL